MLNAIQAWMLQDSVMEKELYEGREKAKVSIVAMLAGENLELEAPGAGAHPTIVYDEFGKPRPARMAYDGPTSDDPPQQRRRPRAVQPLPPETVPTDDVLNPFPGLDPPVG